MVKRIYSQREWRLLSWWLATYHANADIVMNVRVGPIQPLRGNPFEPDVPVSLLKVKNRWADCIYVENGEPTIVEAKIEPNPGIFSQLIHYARKFRADPDFAMFKDKRLHLTALVYNNDPSVAQEAPWYGVTWVVYQPSLDGFLPPSLRGSPLASISNHLPDDWPARLKSWGIEAIPPS